MRAVLVPLSLALAAWSLSACSGSGAIKGVKVARTRVESTVTTTSAGTVAAQQQAVLAFGATGRVARIRVEAGQKVRRGQLLAELENLDLQASLKEAERELLRARELFKADLVSSAALDQAKRGYEVARAALDRTRITAPFDGLVTEENLEMGELSSPPAPGSKAPLRLIDLKPRVVKGDVDEVDLAKVRAGQPARVRIPAVRAQPFAAKVERVVPFVSTAKEKDRTSEIQLQVTEGDPEAIPVGASAEIEVLVEAKDGALAVPSRVILGHGGERYVFRVVDGKLQRVAARPGIGNYASTELLGPPGGGEPEVRAGDVVVFPPDETELREGMRAEVQLQPWP
jgi:HlyD family secretion protein